MKTYWKSDSLELMQGDSLEVMSSLSKQNPDGLFDCIFADPPYFLSNNGITCKSGKMESVNKGDWDKSLGPVGIHSFNLEWLGLCQKLLKHDGTIWISGTHHVIHSVGYALQQLNFKILNDITWVKPNPPPNLACRYFTHSTETILWAKKSPKSKHLFHYKMMKEENNGKQMKSVWEFTAPKKSEKSEGKHPTQKPIDLLLRCIKCSTDENSFVMDPFNGSGTTGLACQMLGRNYMGIELERNYLEISKRRFISYEKSAKQELLTI